MFSKRFLAAASTAALMAPVIASAAEGPGLLIHGFFELPFKNAYITPRGLVVENDGLVMQPVAGLVFPLSDELTFVGGVWNSINTAQGDDDVGPWNECDPFASLSYKWSDFEFSATYVPFLSPTGAFDAEHNIEFAAKYSDKWSEKFAINPYVKFFWAVSGDSTVVLGRKGDTYDVELGIAPSYKLTTEGDWPVTLSFPTWVTVGPENFWGGDQNFGVFCTGVTATVPLKFIPEKYGQWHASVGVSYYYLINDNLVDAAELLGNDDDRSRFVGTVSIGFSF